ncbi:hypothetical protein [Microvirga aerilata]|uniref:hypothetical protein n=1 Tax=Microvirga aerilata TaxID=670292 RepID=UPI001FE4A6D5|nr:hypothetical protein [Microvirga aerilata]
MADFTGTNGDDTLTGGAGDDTLRGRGGSDTLDGGEGFDLVDYSRDQSRTTDVTIDLDQGRAWQGMGSLPTSAEIDTLISIENAIGTGFADRFIGTDAG